MANSGTFQKGDGRPRRKKGVPNKATQHAREAIAAFVDANTEKLQGWLDKIEQQDGPKAAWQCVMDLVEYHVPKLARTELTGEGGTGPVQTVIRHVYEGEPK